MLELGNLFFQQARLPCEASASSLTGTHVATAHPDVSLGDLRTALANQILTSARPEDFVLGMAGLVSLSPWESACPRPDATAILSASVCAWLKIVEEEDEIFFTFSFVQPAAKSLAYVLNSLFSTAIKPSPVLQPGPRALAATGGASQPNFFRTSLRGRPVKPSTTPSTPTSRVISAHRCWTCGRRIGAQASCRRSVGLTDGRHN